MHSRRLADIGQLASSIAHEMRNPLAAIKVAAFNINRKAGNPAIEKHIATINLKVKESDGIITNLLTYSRIRTANYEKVCINDLLKDCIATMSAKYAGWEVMISTDFGCRENETIDADPAHLKMLLNNVIDNAYQALENKRGAVFIGCRRKNRDILEISVKDNGAGIDKEYLGKIFDPFFTKKAKGTGLGLALCQEVVKVHNGKIEVESTPGKGTTFRITLPVIKPETTAHLHAAQQHLFLGNMRQN